MYYKLLLNSTIEIQSTSINRIDKKIKNHLKQCYIPYFQSFIILRKTNCRLDLVSKISCNLVERFQTAW